LIKHVAILIAAALAGEAAAAPGAGPPTGEVTGTVVVKGKRKSGGVLVYLESVAAAATPPPTDHAVIRQREKQFDPPVTIVVRGTTVDFPNEDKVFHNVFSVSRPARFDLGLYKSGTTKSVEMKRAGTVDVYCNIHPDMVAKVKVLENGYYTITDDSGRFRISGVPEGDFPIVAWLPTGDYAAGTATVKTGQPVELRLEITATAHKESHTRKDGTPYGRYK